MPLGQVQDGGEDVIRLIDADALKESVSFGLENEWPEDLAFKFPSMINNAPTINAIPVDWLEQRFRDTSVVGDNPDYRRNAAYMFVLEDWDAEQKGTRA